MGSKVRGTDIILSAPQVRAARSLLGWSRRELAIVSGVSSGTIKAIEQGSTDPRLSTLRKLARTFKAHSVEFLFEGRWTGVVIAMTSVSDQPKVPRRIPGEDQPAAISPSTLRSEQEELICDVNPTNTISNRKPLGRWFGAQRRPRQLDDSAGCSQAVRWLRESSFFALPSPRHVKVLRGLFTTRDAALRHETSDLVAIYLTHTLFNTSVNGAH